jgi:hypothetical protein
LMLLMLLLGDCHVLCFLLGSNHAFSIPFLLVFLFQPAHKVRQGGLIGSHGRCNIVLPKGLPQPPSQGPHDKIVRQESRPRQEMGAVNVAVAVAVTVAVNVNVAVTVTVNIGVR